MPIIRRTEEEKAFNDILDAIPRRRDQRIMERLFERGKMRRAIVMDAAESWTAERDPGREPIAEDGTDRPFLDFLKYLIESGKLRDFMEYLVKEFIPAIIDLFK